MNRNDRVESLLRGQPVAIDLESAREEQSNDTLPATPIVASTPNSKRQRKKRVIASIEDYLVSNLDAIKQQVKSLGRWCIPEDLQGALTGMARDGELQAEIAVISGEQKQRASAQELFQKSDLLLEKFCLLKIKEIITYLKSSAHKIKKANSQINLAILEHTGQGQSVKVMVVQLEFDQYDLACSIVDKKKLGLQSFASELKALKLSGWLHEPANEIVIRFADREIERTLPVRCYCKEIKYAVVSDAISTPARNKNFWENFAIERKKSTVDLTAVSVVKQEIAAMYARYQEGLTDKLQQMAKFSDDIDQSKHVKGILKNQYAGLGTLLYLPTGFGKTFIMLMAMAQHFLKLPAKQRKPYLVVVPKNAIHAWQSNIESLRAKEQRLEIKIFDTELQYKVIGSKKDGGISFNELLDIVHNDEQQAPHFCLTTKEQLTNTVKKYFAGREKTTPIIHKHRPLLEQSGVLIGEKYGGWQKRRLGNAYKSCFCG
jgi:hypothetical protein